MTRLSAAACAFLVVALAGLPGCRPGGDEGAGDASRAKAKTVKPADPLAHMVSAVSPGRQSAPVELKFSLDHRPEVGKPMVIEIAVLPVSELDRIGASFAAGNGLELQAGEQMPSIDRPARGVPLNHRITIVPQREGIFFVSAVVLADSPEQSLTRTFSIPIIAGTAPPPERDSKPESNGR
jgi:hypothetical protein